MTPHEPGRFAVALVTRCLPDNEGLAGDLLEASHTRSAVWLWRQVLTAMAIGRAAEFKARPQAAIQTLGISMAMLALLAFYALVVAGLVERLDMLSHIGGPMAVLLLSVLVAGLASRRVYPNHRVGRILTFGSAATLAALAAGPYSAALIGAQNAQTFDVVSIRRNLTNQQQGGGLAAPQPGGRYIGLGVTLRRLVGDAYEGIEVRGGPSWIATDRFDVNARAEGNPTPLQIMRMLRPMLADRFKLVAHIETPVVDAFALTLDRADRRLGERLRQSDAKCAEDARNLFPGTAPPGPQPQCGDFRMGGAVLTARGMTMDSLARVLSGNAGRPVVDRTGLGDQAFDLDLEWSNDPAGVSVFTALREQLGLKLDPTQARVDVIVVDRAEPPTPD